MSYNRDMEGCHACPRTDGRTDGQRNVKIELKFWKQNLQYTVAMGTVDIRLLLAFDLQFHCNLASALFGFDPKSN